MKDVKAYIDFIITQMCSYTCEYCSQSKAVAGGSHASDEVVDGFLSALEKLTDRNFEITITGGEPLLHPRFMEIISKIKDMGYKIAIVSNFSSSAQKFKEIIDLLDDSLTILMFSAHTHQIKNIDNFIDKALIVKSYTHPATKMKICSPVWKNNLAQLCYIEKRIKKAFIEFEPQHIRISNRFYEYDDKEKELLESHDAAINKDAKCFSCYCYAGQMSAVVYENGDIYRCYSSRYIKSHMLGNIVCGEFNFYKKTKVCPLLKCTCPKPFAYNMLTNKKNYFKGIVSCFYNALFLPFKIAGNAKNLLIKIKQKNKINSSCE